MHHPSGTHFGRQLLLFAAASAPAACALPQPRRFNLAADVLFEFGRADLRPQAAGALQDILTQVRATYRRPVLLVVGHTDSIGSDALNDALSLRRAQAVETWFVAAGVPASSIQTQGFGKRQPIAPNQTANGADDPVGRARNRRVEIVATEGA